MSMDTRTIIWDFDGTLLPLDPYDSEQSLLRFQMGQAPGAFPLHRTLAARAIIYADRKEWLPGIRFKRPYVWLLKGTPIDALDTVARRLARKIPKPDRLAVRRLARKGYDMRIISCGTADLSRRVLDFAGLTDCFGSIMANEFQMENDRITGMEFTVLAPADKVSCLKAADIDPRTCVAVGDGYTDIPLLDHVGMPVMIDRTGAKRNLIREKRYHGITAVPELLNLPQLA